MIGIRVPYVPVVKTLNKYDIYVVGESNIKKDTSFEKDFSFLGPWNMREDKGFEKKRNLWENKKYFSCSFYVPNGDFIY